MNKDDCIRLVAVVCLLATMLAVSSAGGQTSATWIDQINSVRSDRELRPVVADARLDPIARQQLDQLLAARCICPAVTVDASLLLDDVRLALGSDDAVVDASVVAGYNDSRDGAITTTINDPANGAAILGARMAQAGIATAVIESGQSWLAPPPGGGEEIDLTGFTIVVIVMAGTGP